MKTFSILTMSLNLPYLALSIGIVRCPHGRGFGLYELGCDADATGKNEQPLRKAIDKSLKKLPAAPEERRDGWDLE